MLSRPLTIATLALAASASPLVVVRRDDPKPAKTGSGLFGGFGFRPPSSSAGGGLDGMMSASDVKKGDFSCKKAALLFARGTGEPGNMGFVVGPGLGSGMKKAMNGDVLIQGVDYSTNFSGGGATEMVKLVKSIKAKCPNTKIVLGGYSQGAMQVHQALGSLGPDAVSVSVAVTFGDPYSNQGWGTGGVVGSVMGLGRPGAAAGGGGVNGFDPNNGLIICSNGDFVCGVVPNIGGAVPKATAADTKPAKAGAGHISYSADGSIPKALAFIAARIDSKGESSSEAESAPKSAAKSQPKSKTPPTRASAAEVAAEGPDSKPTGRDPADPKPVDSNHAKGKPPPFAGELPLMLPAEASDAKLESMAAHTAEVDLPSGPDGLSKRTLLSVRDFRPTLSAEASEASGPELGHQHQPGNNGVEKGPNQPFKKVPPKKRTLLSGRDFGPTLLSERSESSGPELGYQHQPGNNGVEKGPNQPFKKVPPKKRTLLSARDFGPTSLAERSEVSRGEIGYQPGKDPLARGPNQPGKKDPPKKRTLLSARDFGPTSLAERSESSGPDLGSQTGPDPMGKGPDPPFKKVPPKRTISVRNF
ncbi:carbohydrate esterase family 5 protein [Venturia nashicola]|nr:carbohydrate esterase family 5 protein [Venturia nashicola]